MRVINLIAGVIREENEEHRWAGQVSQRQVWSHVRGIMTDVPVRYTGDQWRHRASLPPVMMILSFQARREH